MHIYIGYDLGEVGHDADSGVHTHVARVKSSTAHEHMNDLSSSACWRGTALPYIASCIVATGRFRAQTPMMGCSLRLLL